MVRYFCDSVYYTKNKAVCFLFHSILLKVCNFLRSRALDIRNTARDTLVKILTTLGTRFFPYILSDLKGTLKRGYQRHVLCYTVHQLLKKMEAVIQPGDIDICLKSLQEVCCYLSLGIANHAFSKGLDQPAHQFAVSMKKLAIT